MVHIEAQGIGGAMERLRLLTPAQMERAGRRAVRQTLKGARTDAAKQVRQRYNVKYRDILGALKLKVGANLNGEMTAKGSGNPLERFKISWRGKYVHAEVVKGQGGIIKRAFWRKGKLKARVGAQRYPIKRLTSVSDPGMLSHPFVSSYVEERMEARLAKNLNHEINAIANGFAV